MAVRNWWTGRTKGYITSSCDGVPIRMGVVPDHPRLSEQDDEETWYEPFFAEDWSGSTVNYPIVLNSIRLELATYQLLDDNRN